MKRRSALKYTSLLTAAGLSATTISSIISGCKSESTVSKYGVISSDQIEQIRALVDIIIPQTDTPGAVEAGVPEDLALHINDNFSEEDQKRFVEGLSHINNISQTSYGASFAHLSDENKTDIMNELASEEDDSIFDGLKNLTIYLFFTSEKGAKEVLNYLPVPGEYLPCVDYSEIGSAWALR